MTLFKTINYRNQEIKIYKLLMWYIYVVKYEKDTDYGIVDSADYAEIYALAIIDALFSKGKIS